MSYFVRRLVYLVGTLWVAITINFMIPRLMPGNPVEALMGRMQMRGALTKASIHAFDVMLGFHVHETIWQQYVQYLGQVIHFNFGVSYTYFPYSVSYMIGQALPWTLALVGIATVISFILGTALGIVTAMRRGRTTDSTFTLLGSFTNTFPYFWFALACLYFLSYEFHLFPLLGAYGNITPAFSAKFIGSAIHHGILPALTIVVGSYGGWLLSMRNNMINTLDEDYVLLAEAKGLKRSWVSWAYVARNALLPNLTGFAMALGFVVGGSLLTEIVFAYPGIGYLLYNSVLNADYPLMQGIFLIIVVCVVFANFLADLAYVLIDPRVRKGAQV